MIQNESLIVSLSISQWTARKHDKKVTDEVNRQHNASNDAGRYNKLLASKEHTEAIGKVASKARNFHYDNTLPWGDNNERLLPAKNYFDYVTEMNKLKSEFEHTCNDFFANYDLVINEARVRLNGMFNERDYPSRSEISEKFRFKTVFMPVPETDFRVHLKDEEVESLRKQVGLEVENRLADAVKDIWERIKDHLRHMKDRLSDQNAVFRDSLFDNLRELINLLPRLNVTNDQSINGACNDMVKLLVDPDSVRNNVSLRAQKADEVDQLLNKFNTFFS